MPEQQQSLTIQQAIDLGVQHHKAGRLPQAERIYQQILQADPNQPVAMHLLGVIAHQVGKNDTAVDLITKALAINPDFAEAHCNLGNALQELGKLDEAVASYHKALALKPNHAEAYSNLGAALQDLGKLEDAVASYHKALAIKPDYAEAHNNLGNALKDLGKLDEAVASYHKALAIKPDFSMAHNNLGNALKDLGKIEEAVTSHRNAIDLKPDYAEAHNNLGNALRELGKLEDAVTNYQKALAIKPDLAETHNNLGGALMDLGKLEEADDSCQRALAIRPDFPEALGNCGILLLTQGGRQEALSCFDKRMELVRGENPTNPDLESFRFITKAKMKHDIEQFRYLESLGTDADQFGKLARTYSELDREIQWPDNESTTVPLSEEHRDRIGSSYNRPLHLLERPEIPGTALNLNLNTKSITQSYMSNAPGMTYFDNFLNPEALHALRRFLMESTIWYEFKYSGGYLGAMLADGMACPLLFQIADELRQTFPDIFKHHPLKQLWAYKYDSQLTGINVHADFAAINVNFWITPDSANRNPTNGGLIVHKKEAPLEWSFNVYNKANKRIREFLAEHDSGKMVVPYAENRVVLFNSNLFHETDRLEFKTGYKNRRINITMLFGSRRD